MSAAGAGGGAAASSFFIKAMSLFAGFTMTKKTTPAVMRKPIAAPMINPRSSSIHGTTVSTIFLAPSTTCSTGIVLLPIGIFKSGDAPPPSPPRIGSTKPLVNAVTIPPKAAPMMTPVERSTTLPLRMNFLNSLSMIRCLVDKGELASDHEASQSVNSFIGACAGQKRPACRRPSRLRDRCSHPPKRGSAEAPPPSAPPPAETCPAQACHASPVSA